MFRRRRDSCLEAVCFVSVIKGCGVMAGVFRYTSLSETAAEITRVDVCSLILMVSCEDSALVLAVL